MKYYLKKILGFLFTIFLVSVITFVIFQILPGDPAQIILGVDADPAQLESLRATMNLDKGYVPASEDFFGWLKTMFLPSLSIAFGSSAVLARYIRVSIANQQKQDYVRTAKKQRFVG